MLPGVSKTSILTLRARAEEHERPDRVFDDPLAAKWWKKVEWPPELDVWYGAGAHHSLAFRADDIDRIVRAYRATVAGLSIVELGCGLSTRQSRLADLQLDAWVDLDLPEVVALRERWGAGSGSAHRHLASSVLDSSWMDRIPGRPDTQLFIAEGLFYYLPRAEVDRIYAELRARFSGSVILFDALGKNDYPTLLRNTLSVGAPIQWKLEGDFANVLAEFGLGPVEGLDPDTLMNEALARYWPRFDKKVQGLIALAMDSTQFWPGRSGMVLGRL